jgi:cytochrome c biogenesis protein ResB
MTDLYDRLFPQWPSDKKGEKIAFGALSAFLEDCVEMRRPRSEIVDAFKLETAAVDDLDAILARLSGLTKRNQEAWLVTFERVSRLAEMGLAYTSKQAYWERLTVV